MLAFKVNPYIEKLAQKSKAIKKEFYPTPEENNSSLGSDPLEEEKHMPIFGLIHKYPNRVLVLLTLNCAAYCRFCTRRRSVSDIKKGKIGAAELKQMAVYIQKHPKINEVILSGGDPFTVPRTLQQTLKIFGSLKQIKIIRIGTRLPVSYPVEINETILNIFKKVPRNLCIYLFILNIRMKLPKRLV